MLDIMFRLYTNLSPHLIFVVTPGDRFLVLFPFTDEETEIERIYNFSKNK